MVDTLSKSALIGRIGGGLAGLSVTQISNIVHTICGLPAAYGAGNWGSDSVAITYTGICPAEKTNGAYSITGANGVYSATGAAIVAQ